MHPSFRSVPTKVVRSQPPSLLDSYLPVRRLSPHRAPAPRITPFPAPLPVPPPSRTRRTSLLSRISSVRKRRGSMKRSRTWRATWRLWWTWRTILTITMLLRPSLAVMLSERPRRTGGRVDGGLRDGRRAASACVTERGLRDGKRAGRTCRRAALATSYWDCETSYLPPYVIKISPADYPA